MKENTSNDISLKFHYCEVSKNNFQTDKKQNSNLTVLKFPHLLSDLPPPPRQIL